MEKFKTLLKWYNLTAVIVILFVAVVFASVESADVGKARPDVINIDSIKTFGDLERPSVLFLHDKHTDAVEKSGGDCTRDNASCVLQMANVGHLGFRSRNDLKSKKR